MSKITDLSENLRKLLASGAYPAGARFPSEYELMERYSVSRITANKAVALLTAEGLLERGRRGSGTFVRHCRKFPQGWIAAMMQVSHPYNAEMVSGAAQTALQNNHIISLLNPHGPEITDTWKKIEQSDCIGVLTTGYGLSPENFSKPVIYLDHVFDEMINGKQHFVACDNYNAACEMADKTLAAGIREPVMITESSHLHRRQRLQGFMDVFAQHNIPNLNERSFILRETSWRYEVSQILRRIMRNFPEVDCILTDSDDVAWQVIKVCRHEKIDCPGRIKLTGFGNVHGISDVYNLPTIDQHPWHIGSEAVTALLELVKSPSCQEKIKVEVPAEVINTEFL